MSTEHYAWPTIENSDLIDVVSHLDTALDKADETVYGIDKRVEKNSEDIGALDVRVTKNEDDISELDKRVSSAEGEITELDGRVTAAEADIMQGNERNVTALTGSFDDSTRTLTVNGSNSSGDVKTTFNAVISGGGGSEVNSLAPLTLSNPPTAFEPNNPNFPNIAIGSETYSGAPDKEVSGAVAIGNNSGAVGDTSTAVGGNSGASSLYATAVGGNAIASGGESTAVGAHAYVKNVERCTAIGNSSACYAEDKSSGDEYGVVSVGGSKTTDSVHVAHTKRIINVSKPINDNDAATKAYVKKVVTALCTANNLTLPDFD